MNCFNHPVEVAAAQCLDCGKGLCPDCASLYTICICSSCNTRRIKNEKATIIKELLFTFLGGAVLTYLFMKMLTSGSQPVPFDAFTYVLLFYLSAGIIAGWQTLTRLTPAVFLILPIIGWLIYFLVKLVVAFYVGLVMLPVRTIRNLMRIRSLNKIPV